MVNVAIAGMAAMYIWPTGEHVPATTISSSTRGVWGLGHVFEGKLYFTKDIVDGNFVPRNQKLQPTPKPEPKPAPKPAPKGQACAIV